MNPRIQEKILKIEEYLEELTLVLPDSFKAYCAGLKTKAACERYFEKITEAIVDLAFLAIKEEGLKTPEEDKQAFDILCDAKLINASLAASLKEAKGMRNFLAHQYGEIDNRLVFRALKRELQKDAQEFLSAMEKTMR